MPEREHETIESTRCERACEILEATNDGEELAPEHLKLIELVVNGMVNETGKNLFDQLHATVTNGTYQKPWLHGVEHLTRDHEGYVYWKGHHVEHWSGSLPHSEEGKREAIELARRCQLLEAHGETPDVKKVAWDWKEPNSAE